MVCQERGEAEEYDIRAVRRRVVHPPVSNFQVYSLNSVDTQKQYYERIFSGGHLDRSSPGFMFEPLFETRPIPEMALRDPRT